VRAYGLSATLGLVRVAFAVAPMTGAVIAVPSLNSNVTVPVGVPDAGASGTTRAMNVEVWPTVAGSGADVTVVLVAAGWTDWVSVPREVPKSAEPS